jgi:hypothetical protein
MVCTASAVVENDIIALIPALRAFRSPLLQQPERN